MFNVFGSKVRVQHFRLTRNKTHTTYNVEGAGRFHAWKVEIDKKFTDAKGAMPTEEKAREFKAHLEEAFREISWEAVPDNEIA